MSASIEDHTDPAERPRFDRRTVEAALDRLTLEEKVRLLTGRDFWSTHPIERIGLRSMTLSDGPSGVRGPVWDERSPSLNLPSASSLSSSWDTRIAGRYGAVAAGEARRKGVDIVLGPTINLHRSPRGGRHFEAFSEDPVLTGDLAASYISGLQGSGVGATPKHYIANDSETDRFTVDVRVDDRTLRELYLLAFERAVSAAPWLVMSSYNSINGVTATESELLETPLSSEWGFDGVVVSDWTAVRSLASASAAQDLAMPGPGGAWGDALLGAVRDGRVPESLVDRKVERLLRLATRVGALGTGGPAPLVDVEDGRAFARSAAVEGMVLLENRGELPWEGSSLSSVAVIGNNAELFRSQGGGSATVVPEHVVSPLDGIRAALPHARVRYAVGAMTQTGLAGIPVDRMIDPVTGQHGARVSFRDAGGIEIYTEHRRATELIWFGGEAPVAAAETVDVVFDYLPPHSGTVEIGFAATGHGRFWLDGDLVIDEEVSPEGDDLGAAFLSPATRTVPVRVVENAAVAVRFSYESSASDAALANALSLFIGTQPAATDPQALIEDAVELARRSDVAVVVVGTNSRVESEGFDRTSLRLPGHQDDLVRAVAAANPHTVVVVNSGAPVLMPWRADVQAVMVGWFGGQEFGGALADVLLGAQEPGGRLPTTWPSEEPDVPVLETVPVGGALAYDEGVHIGYRAWLRSEVAPAYWFGHGLGYTTIELGGDPGALRAAPGEVVTVVVDAVNTGARAGKQVVQVYAERAETTVDRPARWLVGFAAVRLEAGQRSSVQLEVPTRLLAHWTGRWSYEPGRYLIRIGTSCVDLPIVATLDLDQEGVA